MQRPLQALDARPGVQQHPVALRIAALRPDPPPRSGHSVVADGPGVEQAGPGVTKLVKWRSGSAARISCLERDHGWGAHSRDLRRQTWRGWGVVAHNVPRSVVSSKPREFRARSARQWRHRQSRRALVYRERPEHAPPDQLLAPHFDRRARRSRERVKRVVGSRSEGARTATGTATTPSQGRTRAQTRRLFTSR